MSKTSKRQPALISVLQPFVDSHSLAGAVTLVASAEDVLDVGAIGWADIAGGRPMQEDALFWIASMTKPITATALMLLVDAGTVRLDDPVERYLPEFTDLWLAVERDAEHVLLRRPSRQITVRDLLSHTSGLPFCTLAELPTMDQVNLRLRTRTYAMAPLDFDPGSRFQYSNAGINLAGRIIEVVSGQAYETFLDERLLGPLGMTDTTFWPTPRQLERLATSYRPDAAKTGLEAMPIAQLAYPLHDRSRTPMPAGGLFSTAGDMARFGRMIFNGGVWKGRRLICEGAVAQMLTRQSYPAVKDTWGLGWWTDGAKWGHGGAHATNLEIDSRTGLLLVYMVQHAGFPNNGGEAHPTFRAAAEARFARAAPR